LPLNVLFDAAILDLITNYSTLWSLVTFHGKSLGWVGQTLLISFEPFHIVAKRMGLEGFVKKDVIVREALHL
jgi:hypothetical protein